MTVECSVILTVGSADYKCFLYFIVLYCTGNVFLADRINELCLCWQRWIHVTTTMAVVSRPVCQEQVSVSTAVSVMTDGSLTSMVALALHLVSTCFNVLGINWLLKCRCSDMRGIWKWNEMKWKCINFKCVWKLTKSRLSLTHHVNKSSRSAE